MWVYHGYMFNYYVCLKYMKRSSHEDVEAHTVLDFVIPFLVVEIACQTNWFRFALASTYQLLSHTAATNRTYTIKKSYSNRSDNPFKSWKDSYPFIPSNNAVRSLQKGSRPVTRCTQFFRGFHSFYPFSEVTDELGGYFMRVIAL